MTAFYQQLIHMYQASPINGRSRPDLSIASGSASIQVNVDPNDHHAAGALHGSILFKMLDDSAFFSAQSLESEVFVVTANFHVYFIKPVTSGRLIAKGTIVTQTKRQFICDSHVFNEKEEIIAKGSGAFVRSSCRLTDTAGFSR